MAAKAIVCDSSVIRGMSNDPRNICYHYRHHLVGKQVYHCEISFREVVDGLMSDCQVSQDKAETFFANWIDEFSSEPLSPTKTGEIAASEIQRRLSLLDGLIPRKTENSSEQDCQIAGETIARKIPELAAHDKDFLIIEIVCGGQLSIVMLEMSNDGLPERKQLSSQHRQRLEERLELAGTGLSASLIEAG